MPEVFICTQCKQTIEKEKDRYVVAHTRGDSKELLHEVCYKRRLEMK